MIIWLGGRSEIGTADSVAANERSELNTLYDALSVRQNQCSESPHKHTAKVMSQRANLDVHDAAKLPGT